MKRLILTTGLALVLGLGQVYAQNITKSLQGSQDPRGPVGLDVSNSAYFPGHINAFGNTGAVSQWTATKNGAQSCIGTGALGTSLATGSTDVAGQVLIGNTTGCTVQFGTAFNNPPNCIVQTNTLSTLTITPVVTTTSQMLIGGTAVGNVQSGAVYTWLCIGNQ